MKTVKQAMPYLLAVLCISASAIHVLDGYKSMDPSRDMVSGWEQRMKTIRAVLPAGVYEAGYLENADVPDSSASHDPAEFFLAQYGVAPVVLVRGFGPEWLIANFGGRIPFESVKPWLDRELGEYEVREMGFGLYLIHDTGN
jgi:hypothetical protein